ncbi:HlyD family secretion protein [Cyanobium sp. Morenito 9A2]|nr:HlyD family secretion protein [Cyanobium sp. Morenito 9A2]
MPSKRSLGMVVGTVALLGVGAWVISHWGIESTDDAQIQAHLYRMSSRLPGTVAQVLVEANQPVRKGQVLLRLDDSDQRAAVGRAEADLAAALAKAEAARVTVGADRSEADASRQQADGAQQEAKAELERTRTDLERFQRLHAAGAASQQQLELARSQFQLAQGRLSRSAGSRASAQSDQAKISVDRSKAVAAASEVLQARSALASARLQLGYTTVVAPADAVVGAREVEPGQSVQPSQGLLSLVGRSVWVEANFKETQVGQMRAHNRAEVHVDALPGVSFQGQVSSLSPASGARFALLPPDNATGNFTKVVQRVTVRIDLEPAALERWRARLKPGLSVTAKVHT